MLERFEGVLAQQAVALEGLYADNSHLREALEQNRVAALAKEGALQGRIDALELQLQAEKRDAAHQIRTLQATLNAVHHSAQKALDTVGRQHPHSSPGSIIKHHLASLESIKVELETILANVSTNFTIVS
jgi:DNA anti-recombination protein RmuC